MNLFSPITLKWWQVSIFKLSMVSLGVFIGATWPVLFESWTTMLLVVFILTTAYLLPMWWKHWTKKSPDKDANTNGR